MKRSLFVVGVLAGVVNLTPAHADGRNAVRIGDGSLRERISDRLENVAQGGERLGDAVGDLRDRLDDARDDARDRREDRREDRRDRIDDRRDAARDRIGDLRERLADAADNLGEGTLIVRQDGNGALLARSDGSLNTALRSGLRTTVLIPSD